MAFRQALGRSYIVAFSGLHVPFRGFTSIVRFQATLLCMQGSKKKLSTEHLPNFPTLEQLACLIRERRSIFPKDFCYEIVDRLVPGIFPACVHD